MNHQHAHGDEHAHKTQVRHRINCLMSMSILQNDETQYNSQIDIRERALRRSTLANRESLAKCRTILKSTIWSLFVRIIAILFTCDCRIIFHRYWCCFKLLRSAKWKLHTCENTIQCTMSSTIIRTKMGITKVKWLYQFCAFESSWSNYRWFFLSGNQPSDWNSGRTSLESICRSLRCF